MAADRFPSQRLDALRLKLMQEVLPVGLAVADRARKGGAKDVIAAFQGDEDPIEQLRQEGSEAASQVRERLDRLSPGLGNPVMKVEVRDVEPTPASPSTGSTGVASDGDKEELLAGLARITAHLAELERRIG